MIINKKFLLTMMKTIFYNLYIGNKCSLYTRGDEFMKKQLIEKLKEQDKELLSLLKQGHKKLIAQVITDYLSQRES